MHSGLSGPSPDQSWYKSPGVLLGLRFVLPAMRRLADSASSLPHVPPHVKYEYIANVFKKPGLEELPANLDKHLTAFYLDASALKGEHQLSRNWACPVSLCLISAARPYGSGRFQFDMPLRVYQRQRSRIKEPRLSHCVTFSCSILQSTARVSQSSNMYHGGVHNLGTHCPT